MKKALISYWTYMVLFWGLLSTLLETFWEPDLFSWGSLLQSILVVIATDLIMDKFFVRYAIVMYTTFSPDGLPYELSGKYWLMPDNTFFPKKVRNIAVFKRDDAIETMKKLQAENPNDLLIIDKIDFSNLHINTHKNDKI